MKLLSALTLAAALAVVAAPAFAADPLTECVDLGATHVVRRAGDSAVAIQDGAQHYRAEMRYGCNDLGYSAKLKISTDKQEGRLCPQGSKLATQRDLCSISRVEKIDEQAFKRYIKR
ncbi:hypothetical protein A7A76_21575 [Lysobacter enzymogenes]|uniref:DUF6491 family protein n=1 Tax=Lysobacter enzymogenes TaxID=69 RepID=UPI0019D2DF5E|nr:DUF6491 family protein [Lysobacter enzymogenes]MBN7137312.1 hypothetical protein [Lysobacter enzymogenes]